MSFELCGIRIGQIILQRRDRKVFSCFLWAVPCFETSQINYIYAAFSVRWEWTQTNSNLEQLTYSCCKERLYLSLCNVSCLFSCLCPPKKKQNMISKWLGQILSNLFFVCVWFFFSPKIFSHFHIFMHFWMFHAILSGWSKPRHNATKHSSLPTLLAKRTFHTTLCEFFTNSSGCWGPGRLTPKFKSKFTTCGSVFFPKKKCI